MAAVYAVGQLLAHGAPELDFGVADIPLAHGLVGQAVGQLQAQLGTIFHVNSICEVVHIAGVVIVIAVVSQQVADTAALAFQGADAEGGARLDKRFGGGAVDEVLGYVGEADVGYTVVGEKRVEAYVVGYLALLGILTRYRLVGDRGTEEAIVLQHRLCHRGTQGGVDGTHQHRRPPERLVDPLGKGRLLAAKPIVNPQPPGEWHAVVAAAEERTVGSGGKGGFHLGLGVGQVRGVGVEELRR